MKISDLISKIDKNNKYSYDDPAYETLANLFNIYNFYNYPYEKSILTSYWIKTHLCTDSYVGWKAYYLNDEFVAVSSRVGRKYDEEFEFVSIEAAKKVKDYLLTLVEAESFNVDIIDQEQEYPNTYNVEFQGGLLSQFHKKGEYNNEEVEIITTYKGYDTFHDVEIKHSNGKKEIVDVREIKFEYGVNYDLGHFKYENYKK